MPISVVRGLGSVPASAQKQARRDRDAADAARKRQADDERRQREAEDREDAARARTAPERAELLRQIQER